MWTAKDRRAADRSGLRYPSDLTEAEWAIVEPMIPPARHGGRKRSVNLREVLNGIFYTLWTGGQWKALPKDLPPKITVHDCLELWNWDGTSERIHHALYMAVREQEDREASPLLRSSIRRPQEARKRGVLARSSGLRRGQEGHGSQPTHPGRHAGPLAECRRASGQCSGSQRRVPPVTSGKAAVPPFIAHIFADGRCAGPRMALVVWRTGAWKSQIVKQSDAAGVESCPSDGSSKERSPGLAATAVWRATLNAMPARSQPSSVCHDPHHAQAIASSLSA